MVLLVRRICQSVCSVWRYEAEVKTQRQRSGTAQGRTISEAAASNPAHLTGHQSPRQQAEGCSELSAAAAERASSCSISICASHVGTYAFKGCGEVEVVCLTSDAVAGSIVAPPMSSKSSKGIVHIIVRFVIRCISRGLGWQSYSQLLQ